VITIHEAGRPTRTVRVDGTPDAHLILSASSAQRHLLTLSYSPGLKAFTFSFG